MKTYTKQEVVDIIDKILEHPDEVMDAIQNENTWIGGWELFDLIVTNNDFAKAEVVANPVMEIPMSEKSNEDLLSDFATALIASSSKIQYDLKLIQNEILKRMYTKVSYYNKYETHKEPYNLYKKQQTCEYNHD